MAAQFAASFFYRRTSSVKNVNERFIFDLFWSFSSIISWPYDAGNLIEPHILLGKYSHFSHVVLVELYCFFIYVLL